LLKVSRHVTKKLQFSFNHENVMKKRVSSKVNVKFDLLKQKRNMENKYLTTGITYDLGTRSSNSML